MSGERARAFLNSKEVALPKLDHPPRRSARAQGGVIADDLFELKEPFVRPRDRVGDGGIEFFEDVQKWYVRLVKSCPIVRRVKRGHHRAGHCIRRHDRGPGHPAVPMSSKPVESSPMPCGTMIVPWSFHNSASSHHAGISTPVGVANLRISVSAVCLHVRECGDWNSGRFF